ncbi:MAG TPA: nickel insertion protein, partial [Longimicrobiales bacterium]
MKALIFDPFAGISGDMTLGALIDLGLDPEWLQQFVAHLGLGDITVNVSRTRRSGIDSARVAFELPHEHAHRHLKHVVEIINRSNASDVTKSRAIEAFTLLARAEAEVHGTTIEKVHFHEVGALDAILDVLCSMAAIEQLGFEEF